MRQRLYELMDDPDVSLREKQRQALSLGQAYLDVATAHIQRQTDDGTHEIVASVGSGEAVIPEGVMLDQATTYCRRTIEATSPVALSNAPEEGWADDPAYAEHGWDCYLGATIFVGGEVYGTVCFVDETARETEFAADEKAFAELIARLLGRAIEAADYEQRLETAKTEKQRSEATYEALLQLAPDAVFVADAETGRIETANEKAVELTGYAANELESLSVIDLHPEENREQYVELLEDEADEQIREQFDDGTPLYIRRADGSDVPVEIGRSRVELDDGPVKVGIVRDISERRERESDLERKQSFLEQTQETVSLGGWELAFGSGFTQVSDEAYRILDQPIGSDLTVDAMCDCFHDDDRATIRDAFERLDAEGDPFDQELRISVDDGVRWVRIVGCPLDDPDRARGVVRDISDRKVQERTLRIKDRAIEESSVGITIADASESDLPIIYANRGFVEVTGYAMGEVIGRNCRFLQGSGTSDETVKEIRKAIKNEETIRTELLNYRANGTPFWNRLTIAPVTEGATGDVNYFVGIQDDITAQKRRERLIEVLDRVLRHNLRNDMNVVSGYADVIARETTGEAAEMAERIAETAKELVSLTDTVRHFEGRMTDSEPLGPRDVVGDVETVVEELAEEYPATTFRVAAPETVSVLAAQQLRIALRELGDNAAKYTDGEVRFECTTGDDTVAIHIRDSGPGLPTDERTVLEAGRETPLEHGSGLGLWLVNWIVTSLGGEVTTTVDDGSTVTIRLPRADDADEYQRRTGAFTDSIER